MDKRTWLLPVIAAVLLAAAVVSFLDKWLWSNEVFNNLSMGIAYERDEPALVGLKAEAIRYCEAFAPSEAKRSCRIYQDSITDRVPFAHPITAVLGLQTRNLLSDSNWLQYLHRISIEVPLLSGILAIAIWLILTLALPHTERWLAAAGTLILLIVGQNHDRQFSPVPDALRDADSWSAPFALAIFSTAVFVMVRRTSLKLFTDPVWLAFDPHRALFSVAVILFFLSLILPPELNLLLSPIAFGFLILSGLPLIARRDMVSPVAVACILGLLFVAVTAQPLWFMRRLGYAGNLAALIYVGVIAIVSMRTNPRLAWLMPAIALFHLPIAALLGVATAVSEAIVCILRRRISHLLGAASVTAGIALFGIVKGFESAAFAPNSAVPSDAIPMILSWHGLLPALALVSMTLALAVLPFRLQEDRSIALVRAGLLVAAGLIASLIGFALTDQDPALLNAPGFAMFAKTGGYATPGLFGGAILALLLVLKRYVDGHPGDAYRFKNRKFFLLMPAVLLLLSVGKVDLKLRWGVADAPGNFWRYIVAQELHPAWCRYLSPTNLQDEVYYLSQSDPTNDAIIYWSALKGRLRSEAHLFDSSAFKVESAHENTRGCMEQN
jgi:hypothetical protein